MAKVRLSARAFDDLERIFDFMAQTDPVQALETVRRIREGILILEQHPLIGRQVEDGRRELVMGRGVNAYLALYRWMPSADSALVLAVRNAREAGVPRVGVIKGGPTAAFNAGDQGDYSAAPARRGAPAPDALAWW